MTLNPALAGHFDGNIRLVMNHRNQWFTITNPYVTSAISIDGRFLENKLKGDALGAGVRIFSDKSGEAGMSELQIMLNLSFNKSFAEGKHTFDLGVQGGFFEKWIDKTKLVFASQFHNNGFDTQLPSGENIADFKIINLNLHSGILYQYNNPDKLTVTGGFSFFNMPRPNESLLEKSDALSERYVFHVNSKYYFRSGETFLEPGALFMLQNKARDILFGSSIGRTMQNGFFTDTDVSIGVWYRFVDAAVVTMGFEYKKWKFGMSYDVNVSTLHPASLYQGGFELSLIYTDKILTGRKKLPFIVPCLRL